MAFSTFRPYADDAGGFPLLGSLLATPRDTRRARLIVLALLVAFAVAAPFAGQPWPRLPAFLPTYDAAVAVLCLFTAVLLHAQYRGQRAPAYLWLSCGYGFAAVTSFTHGLSVPDTFMTGTLFGDAQTSAWMWMAWHGLFPLFVLGFFWHLTRTPTQVRRSRSLAVAAYSATALFTAFLVIVSVKADTWLPPLMDGTRYRPITLHMLVVAWLLHLVAIGVMMQRVRERRLIDLWIAVALAADAIDLALSGLLVTGRYQLGFYVGRMYGLVTAMSVLVLLLLQMFELQRRFVQAREDVRMHGRRYADLFRSMSEAFYVVEACRDGDRVVDLLYIDRNPAAAAILPGDVMGRRASEVDAGFDARWLDIVDRVLATGHAEEFEASLTRGDRIHAYRVFRAEHQRDQVGILLDDVTDARRAEAALADSEARQRILVQGVPQLLWRTDAGGRTTWASAQWYAYTGLPESTPLGTGSMETVHPDDRERTHASWIAAQKTGRLDVEHRLRAADGSYRWYRSRSEPHCDAGGTMDAWLGSSTDIHELKTLQDRQSVLVAELQHRTRNLMAVVRALADRTARDSAGLEDFRPVFRDRVDALARAQSLLSRLNEDARVGFDEILRAELWALAGLRSAQDSGRIDLEGPGGIRLRSSTVQTLALALHELATNALKYGALSTDAGRLSVHWTLVDETADAPRLRVIWKETGLRLDPHAPAQGGGYGRELIERALPYQLGASTTYAIEPDGVRCEIVMPVSVQTVPPVAGATNGASARG